MEAKRIEFASASEGKVIVVRDERISYLRDKENMELVSELYERIEREFPEAFKALEKYYEDSKPNYIYHRYKVVRKFVRCNFGNLDFTKWDIDENEAMHFERINCPCRGECPLENVVCSPIFANVLTRREEEIVKTVMKGGTAEAIAIKMGISAKTVRSHMNNIISKLGFHSFIEVINWWHENNIDERQ